MTTTRTIHPLGARVAVALFAATAAFTLVGCSTSASPAAISPSSVAAPTPMFSSDDEALAAAEAAYGNYVAISDQIARDGGANPERLENFVTAELLEKGQSDFDFYQDGRLRATGSTGFDSFRAQTIQRDPDQTAIEAYVCLRLANLRIVDANESDVTPVDRENNLPLVVRLLATGPGAKFVVSAGEVWTGKNFC